ncbi:MAG: SAM-dependent methyltransferase [Sphingomonadales bacterium]|jgi:16S rRNA (cytidine1402-2'-O)-methyltransferase
MENSPNKSHGKATLVMMPMPLGSLSQEAMNSHEFNTRITSIKYWVVENARTFRRFVSSLQLGINIDALDIFELHRDFDRNALTVFLNGKIHKGDIGLASEAGVPGMADPGAEIAAWAHRNEVKVTSICGPSSFILALSASGLNGQQFTFHGYAPVKDEELRSFLGKMGKDCEKTGYTQALIEAPYRSDRLIAAMLSVLSPSLKICIACSLHEPEGFIRTRTVAEWQENKPALGKNPCIFLVGK